MIDEEIIELQKTILKCAENKKECCQTYMTESDAFVNCPLNWQDGTADIFCPLYIGYENMVDEKAKELDIMEKNLLRVEVNNEL